MWSIENSRPRGVPEMTSHEVNQHSQTSAACIGWKLQMVRTDCSVYVWKSVTF